jgi:protein-disulfide isomerase
MCPYCRNLAGAFSNYMSQSTDRVAIYFKNYPLDKDCNPALSRTVHEGACELALGAVCAHDQGKFWPYHDQVFSEPPPNATTDDVLRIATAAGLDADQMKTCLASPSASQTLTAQIEEAQRLEVRSTPTVFINGKRLAQIGSFLSAIQSELK